MPSNPQKILEGRYQVVPRSIILLIRNDEVLLLKAAQNKKIFPGMYNGIGGHIERFEDIVTGAKRELKEETGLSCDNLQLAGTVMIDVEEKTGIMLFVFTGNEVQGSLVSSDEGTLHWIKVSELSYLPVVEDVPDLVLKINEFQATGHQFSGKYLYDPNGKRITTWN